MKNIWFSFILIIASPWTLLLSAAEATPVRAYAESTGKLADAYLKAAAVIERYQAEIDREKERLREERRNNDDDDDDDDDNDARRRRSSQIAKRHAELQKKLKEVGKDVLPLFDAHKQASAELQRKLDAAGIGSAFSFAYYSTELDRTIRDRGFRRDFKREDFTLSRSYDPAKLFALLAYELETLQALGIEDPDTLPDAVLQYRTFLNFYLSLDVYRQMTREFYCIPNPRRTDAEELKRRMEIIRAQAKKLQTLLKQNDPDFAKKLDLPNFMQELERHFKQFALREYTRSLLSTLASADGKNKSAISHAHKEIQETLKTAANEYFYETAYILRDGVYVKLDMNMTRWKKQTKKKRSDKKGMSAVHSDTMEKFAERTAQKQVQGKNTETSESVAAAEPGKTPATPDELKAFLKERDDYRENVLGLNSMQLLAGGLPEQNLDSLCKTMTDAIRTQFRDIAQRKKDAGMPAARAYAEAFLAIRRKETENPPFAEEITQIRAAMNELKQNTKSETNAGEIKKEPEQTDSEWE